MEVLLCPKRIGNVENQRLTVFIQVLWLAVKCFVQRVHQVVDRGIVDVHTEHARHLAGGFPLGAGACHEQCLEDAVR